MRFGRAIKRLVRTALPPVFFLSLVAYFVWNTGQGAHGRRIYGERLQLLAEAQADHLAAVSEQSAWSQRVSGLRDRGLDRDTLDERARAMLNLANSDDIVVPYAQNNTLY